MYNLLRSGQRFFARRGESLLNSAVKNLDKLAEQLDKAEGILATEIHAENEDIQAAREVLALREAKSAAALKTLEANRQRSRRIYDRVAGFVA